MTCDPGISFNRRPAESWSSSKHVRTKRSSLSVVIRTTLETWVAAAASFAGTSYSSPSAL